MFLLIRSISPEAIFIVALLSIARFNFFFFYTLTRDFLLALAKLYIIGMGGILAVLKRRFLITKRFLGKVRKLTMP